MSEQSGGSEWWQAAGEQAGPSDEHPGERATAPHPAGRRRRSLVAVAVMVAAVVGAGAGAAVALGGADQPTSLALVPAGTLGADPFADARDAGAPTSVDADGAVVTVRDDLPSDPDTGTLIAPGTTPGLYGDPADERTCDPWLLASLIGDDEVHARTWARVHDVEAAAIRAHLSSLLPAILTIDTWVTDHGVRDGQPVASQAVLQAGTAVLVDRGGTPRVRCASGDPLDGAQPDEADPGRTAGDAWSGYGRATTTIVVPGEPTEALTLTDLATGAPVVVSLGPATTDVEDTSADPAPDGALTLDTILGVDGPWGCGGETVQLTGGAVELACDDGERAVWIQGATPASVSTAPGSEPTALGAAVGDLDGDGRDDGVAIIVVIDSRANVPPEPTVAVFDADARLLSELSASLSGPWSPEALRIVDGVVEIDSSQRSCNACQPGPVTTSRYRLYGNELVIEP